LDLWPDIDDIEQLRSTLREYNVHMDHDQLHMDWSYSRFLSKWAFASLYLVGA